MRFENKKIKQYIKESDYGLPKERKYPLNDEKHINLVIKYFNDISETNKKEVSRNIFRKMNELNLNFEIIPKDNELRNYISLEKNNEYLFKAYYISDDYKKDLKKENFSVSLEDAIINYLNNNYISPMTKIKRKVFIYNTRLNIEKPIFLGNLNIFIYNSKDQFDFEWNFRKNIEYDYNNKLIIKNQNDGLTEDNIKKRNQYIINDYKKKVINLGKRNNLLLVPRLSTDKYNSFFMRFSYRDKIKNKESLSSFINEDTYITSDLHFGKYNQNEDNKIINKINKSVGENDTLIILGDLGFLKNLNKKYLERCIKKIKCKNKFLILGNHDVFTLDFYYKCGFLGIYERFYDKKNKWIFSHQPCNSKYQDDINFHGHLHSSGRYDINIKNTSNKINCYHKFFNRPKKIKELINKK